MIYRTLHSYILKELLRIFLLTASALTTLMAFGGTFKPLTKQGIDVSQLLVILLNLMPAMLAYAIPIAALFAAVLVYWRMSTDNELTACRAGGVSFASIVLPAFVLGLVVASVDLVFVNYVVPHFLQSTERVVLRDLGSLIVSQVARQEKFQYDPLPLVVSADSAELGTSDDPDVSVVILHGMAASVLENGRPSYTAVAQQARIEIRSIPNQDSAEITFKLANATVFDPKNGFDTASGSLDSSIFSGRPVQVPSLVKSKPKFLNGRDLMTLSTDPFKFSQVSEIMDRIELAYGYQEISLNVQRWWQAQVNSGHKGVSFRQLDVGGRGNNTVVLYATNAQVNTTSAPPEQSLSFKGAAAGGVTVDQVINGKVSTRFTCDTAVLVLSQDPLSGTGIRGALQLRGNVQRANIEQGIRPVAADTISLLVELDPSLLAVAKPPEAVGDKAAIYQKARASELASVHAMGMQAGKAIQQLDQTITSELHSRGSFSLSCLTLVLLGAALGILLRGKNPLAVFVVGFVPAIILVLLITAGRQVTEGKWEHVNIGLTLIWAGNGVLLALVAGVYWKLLRQ